MDFLWKSQRFIKSLETFADFLMDFLNPLVGMDFPMEFRCCVMYILQSAPTPPALLYMLC